MLYGVESRCVALRGPLQHQCRNQCSRKECFKEIQAARVWVVVTSLYSAMHFNVTKEDWAKMTGDNGALGKRQTRARMWMRWLEGGEMRSLNGCSTVQPFPSSQCSWYHDMPVKITTIQSLSTQSLTILNRFIVSRGIAKFSGGLHIFIHNSSNSLELIPLVFFCCTVTLVNQCNRNDS